MPVIGPEAGAATTGLPAFDPLDRATLQDQAYLQLRSAVMGGIFQPGTTITIRAAAEALGTSPMPVRAALQRLEVEGALVARGSKRTLEIPALTLDEYVELVDIGVHLEGLAAERAVERITAEEIEEVADACQEMQEAAERGDRSAYVRANWKFHAGIYRASRMEVLLGMIERRWLRIGPHVAAMMPDANAMIASMPNHWQALEALRRRDGAAARQSIVNDLTDCSVTLIEILKNQDQVRTKA